MHINITIVISLKRLILKENINVLKYPLSLGQIESACLIMHSFVRFYFKAFLKHNANYCNGAIDRCLHLLLTDKNEIIKYQLDKIDNLFFIVECNLK